MNKDKIMKRTSGFSLVEMLIAGAILGIILTVLTNLFVSSRKASDVVDERSDQQQQALAARQVLQYELSLAGYRGTMNTGLGSDSTLLENRTFGSNNTVSMTRHSSSAQPDSLTVRYYEDRNYNGSETPVLQTVTYSIGDDNGVSSLFRQQDSGAAIAIIPDVTNLKIECNRLDEEQNCNDLNEIVSLDVTLTYANQQQDTIQIGFQNAQKFGVTQQ
jgi:prepilin-type N-terminal cleavage/methylation domain-containing protein